MKKTTRYLLLILITIIVGTYFYITCCSECGMNVTETEVTETIEEEAVSIDLPEPTSYPFAISDGDYAYNENDNYNFKLSSSSILTPLSDKVTAGVISLKTYLADNAEKVINLTGFYDSTETNNSAFPNLGLARANVVKNHFVENGISSSQINTIGELRSLIPKDDIFLGPISYSIADKAENADDELRALYDKITANPLVLYFNTGEAAINLSVEQRQKVAEISRYLDKVDGATAQVIGHTDSSGQRATNIVLGQERADFAANYLGKNGISSTKIVTSSKGPDVPVASNATEEGKAKNRRTVVTLKK